MRLRSYAALFAITTGLATTAYIASKTSNDSYVDANSGRNSFGAVVRIRDWNLNELEFLMENGEKSCYLSGDKFSKWLEAEDYGCDGTIDLVRGDNLRVFRENNEEVFKKMDLKYNGLVDRHDLKNKAMRYLKEDIDLEKYF